MAALIAVLAGPKSSSSELFQPSPDARLGIACESVVRPAYRSLDR